MNKQINNLELLETTLQQSITTTPDKVARFFKTGKDDYAQHDQFLGINNPTLRAIAKQYNHLTFDEIQKLLQSPYNEKRFLGLIVLVDQYQKADAKLKQTVYDFYVKNLECVNNWNLVDTSAHLIIGAHLLKTNKEYLLQLAESKNLWHRRIAIVATWYFIRKNNLEYTFVIAIKLLSDKHDLIHKAVGWMLRETGKKNLEKLINFLDQHYKIMPRTMLSYALEKMTPEQKSNYRKTKTGTR